MGEKLKKHIEAKKHRVNGWDIISAGLGIGGGILVSVSFIQPKNPANMLRLPISFGLFAASVVAERCRESELLSLEKALDYFKNVLTEQIRLDTVMAQTRHEILQAEEFYQEFPVDRHPLIQSRIGIAPPNYDARQPDPLVSQIQQPQPVQTIEPDPTGDFDPEQIPSGMMFIPANAVKAWFEQMGDDIPQSLKDEWVATRNAIGIELRDGTAMVVVPGEKQ